MAVEHPENLVLAVPANKIDQIVDIIEGSLSVGAGVDDGFGFITSTDVNIDVPAYGGQAYFFKGIWSYDNGATWQDLENDVVVGYASGSGQRTLTFSVSMGSDYGLDDKVSVFIGARNMGIAGYTILYKILFMARPDQPAVTSQPLNQALRYDSREKYLKIHKEGIITLPTSGNTVIPHDLGYIPNFNVYLSVVFDLTTPNSVFWGTVTAPYVDIRNLTITAVSTATVLRKAYYRIYKDI